MKTKFFISIMLIMFFASTSVIGQTSYTVKYKTNADTKKKQSEVVQSIENVKGVETVNFLDGDSHVVSVMYKNDKTNIKKIQKAITKLDYTAEQVKARTKSCCSKKHKCSEKK